MLWLDKILSHSELVKAKNKQLQGYADQISYLNNLVTDLIDDNEIVEGIDYALIAKRKSELCAQFFTQLNEEQQKNKELKRQVEHLEGKYLNDTTNLRYDLKRQEYEINALKHMLDRYEYELENMKRTDLNG